MSNYIRTNFSKEFPLEISKLQYKTMLLLMYSYETRQKHPQALNSPLLGVHQMFFTTQDQNNLFDVFDTTAAEVKKVIKNNVVKFLSRKYKQFERENQQLRKKINLQNIRALHRLGL